MERGEGCERGKDPSALLYMYDVCMMGMHDECTVKGENEMEGWEVQIIRRS